FVIERMDAAQLEEPGRAGAVDGLRHMLVDQLDKLADGRLVDLHAHVIFPPSLKNRLCRYSACFIVGVLRVKCAAMSSMNRCSGSRCFSHGTTSAMSRNSDSDCSCDLASQLVKQEVQVLMLLWRGLAAVHCARCHVVDEFVVPRIEDVVSGAARTVRPRSTRANHRYCERRRCRA